MDCPEADLPSLAVAPLPGEAVDPPSLPSTFAEYPPDLMDSHATDQCHDKHACGRREQRRDPDRHREVEAEQRDLGGVFVERTTISRTSKQLRGSDAHSCPFSAIRNPRACVGGRTGRCSCSGCRGVLVWGWQAVRSAASGSLPWCRQVVGCRTRGRAGRRSKSPADASRSMSTTPSAQSWTFPVSKTKYYLTWWANSMQSRVQYLRALGMLRDRPADYERQCARLQGLLTVSRRCWAERRTSASTLRSCSVGHRLGKSPAASLEGLYGYASNTTGARNCRNTESMLEGQVGNLPGTSKQQLRIRYVLDVPADTSQRRLRPLRQLLPQRALGRR
jgi:hypothetical protein